MQTATQAAAPVDFQEAQARIRDLEAEGLRRDAEIPSLDAKARF